MEDKKGLTTTNDNNEEAEDTMDDNTYDDYGDCVCCIHLEPCVIGDVVMRNQ